MEVFKMSVDTNKVANHPGFLAFKGKNVGTSTEVSSEKENAQDAQESNKDQQLAGGEQGKAE
jgi:hypothetical protein